MVFGRRIGVDLGTANVLVYVKGRGIVINEPAVVAVATRDNSIVAVGTDAREMLGRTPGAIQVIRPMREGVIADYVTTEAMLRYFIGKVVGRVSFVRPEVMICVPAGVTGVEQRAVQDAAEAAGARRPAHLIPEPLAAAIGARIPVNVPQGHMIVDIGGGRTEAAVISMYGIVVSESVRVAGDRLDDAIAAYVKRRHNLVVGDRTAEELKIAIGSAMPLDEEMTYQVRGRDQITGLPRTITVSSTDVTNAIQDPLAADRRRGTFGAGAHAAGAGLRRRRPRHRAFRRDGDAAQPRPADHRGDRHPLLRGGQPDGVRGDGRRNRPGPPGPDQALDARRGRVAGHVLAARAAFSLQLLSGAQRLGLPARLTDVDSWLARHPYFASLSGLQVVRHPL